MPSRTQFRWLPNFFTAARLVLVPYIIWAAVTDRWTLGLWLVIIALVTDFLDGFAAIKLNARTRLGEQLDPVADFALAAAGVIVIIGTGSLPLWIGLVMLIPALFIGYINFFTSKESGIHKRHHVFSVPYLFATWVVTAWFFATEAYGWTWWYVVLTVVLLALAALPKRHRLRAWFAWVLAKRT